MMKERFYRSLYRIRRTEERIAEVYPTDKIKSPIHLSIGQESISVGVCEALQPGDVVYGTYRGHALYLAKGGDLDAMIAELYGRSTGCAGGKGGSMHLVAASAGVMGTSAVVATTIPHAVGYAYALEAQHRPGIVAVFFGDGATEEGVFYESINFAALHRLPVLFVCENNGYAIHTPLGERQASIDICRKVAPHGIPTERVDDGDVGRIFECARGLVHAIRGGAGPQFMECAAYRMREHVGPDEDFDTGYRDRAEATPWAERDSLRTIGEMLGANRKAEIEQAVDLEIDRAFALAESAPDPAPGELFTQVFAESGR